jgi:crossover junction endodeoxyribonuclease RuvC
MLSAKSKQDKNFTVLGIDPGLETTGWALIERKNLATAVCLDFGAVNTTKELPFAKRLEIIFNDIVNLTVTKKPDFIALEEMFFIQRAKTVLATMQARGVIWLAASKNKIPVETFSPRQVKLTVAGSGTAGKQQLARMVQLTLGLKTLPKPADITDAMAIALCFIKTVPLKMKMTATGVIPAPSRVIPACSKRESTAK